MISLVACAYLIQITHFSSISLWSNIILIWLYAPLRQNIHCCLGIIKIFFCFRIYVFLYIECFRSLSPLLHLCNLPFCVSTGYNVTVTVFHGSTRGLCTILLHFLMYMSYISRCRWLRVTTWVNLQYSLVHFRLHTPIQSVLFLKFSALP
jgi:hypothetical protein